MRSSLKVATQIDWVVRMVLGMLAFIRQATEYRSCEVRLHCRDRIYNCVLISDHPVIGIKLKRA